MDAPRVNRRSSPWPAVGGAAYIPYRWDRSDLVERAIESIDGAESLVHKIAAGREYYRKWAPGQVAYVADAIREVL